MADEKRDVFLTFLIVHLADMKARQELTMRATAKLLERATGLPLAEILNDMRGEYDAAKRLHEASMLQDLHDLESGHPWPPPAGDQN